MEEREESDTMGLAVWMVSPSPILRVANTPPPADSVSATVIVGGASLLDSVSFLLGGLVVVLLAVEENETIAC